MLISLLKIAKNQIRHKFLFGLLFVIMKNRIKKGFPIAGEGGGLFRRRILAKLPEKGMDHKVTMKKWGEYDKRRHDKWFLILFLSLLFIVLLYEGGGILMARNDYYFRTWIAVLSGVLKWIGLPVVIAAFIIYKLGLSRMQSGSLGKKAAALLGMVGVGAVAVAEVLVVGALFLLVLETNYETEEQIGETLLHGYTIELLGSNWYDGHYYDYYNIFLKRRCNVDEVMIVKLLEEKYQEDFRIIETDKNGTAGMVTFHVASTISGEKKKSDEILFYVYKNMYGSYSDNYVWARGIDRAQEYLDLNGIAREVDWGWSSREIGLQYTPEDYEQCAEDTAGMIDWLLADPFFRQAGNNLEIVLYCQEGEAVYGRVDLEFGIRADDEYGVSPADRYTDQDAILKELEQALQAYYEAIVEEENKELPMPREADTEEGIRQAEQDLTTPEGAYRQLYETVFREQGYGYECDYNAKGNFYAVLEEGETMFQGADREFRRTVVYDRESKNEECQLFMAYITYYDENGMEYSTGIENSYAVNMTTGQVTPSGKKRWEDVGSQEYQEAAGEK